jgi:hypothetical protein
MCCTLCIYCIISAHIFSKLHNFHFLSYRLTMALFWIAEIFVAIDGSRVLSFELDNLIVIYLIIYSTYCYLCRYQWSRDLRCRSAVVRLLGLRVRIPRRAWMSVCCECCVFSGRDLCDSLVASPQQSYRLWCVVVCELETSRMRRPWPTGRVCRPPQKRKKFFVLCHPKSAPSKSAVMHYAVQ